MQSRGLNPLALVLLLVAAGVSSTVGLRATLAGPYSEGGASALRVAVVIAGEQRSKTIDTAVAAAFKREGVFVLARAQMAAVAARSGVRAAQLNSPSNVRTIAENANVDAVIHAHVARASANRSFARFTLYSSTGQKVLNKMFVLRRGKIKAADLDSFVAATVEEFSRRPVLKPPVQARQHTPLPTSTRTGQVYRDRQGRPLLIGAPAEKPARRVGKRSKTSSKGPLQAPPSPDSEHSQTLTRDLANKEDPEPYRLPVVAIDVSGGMGRLNYVATSRGGASPRDAETPRYPLSSVSLTLNPVTEAYQLVRGLGFNVGASYHRIGTQAGDGSATTAATPLQAWWVNGHYRVRPGRARWVPTMGFRVGYSDASMETAALKALGGETLVLAARRRGIRLGFTFSQPVWPTYANLELAAGLYPTLDIGPQEGEEVQVAMFQPFVLFAGLRGSTKAGGRGVRWGLGVELNTLHADLVRGDTFTPISDRRVSISGSVGYGI